MLLFRRSRRRHLHHLFGTRGAPLSSIPPRRSRIVFSLLRIVGPLYRRLGMGIPRIEIVDAQNEDSVYRNNVPASTKRIYAFRHPSPDDPQVVFTVLDALHRPGGTLHRNRSTTRRVIGASQSPIFLYGRDVPIWAGPIAAWLLPRIGAISVFHEQVQRDSMDEVYRAFRNDPSPIALAPEAQITYHNYRVAPTQRGTARLSVEAAVARRDSDTAVEVVPIGLEYRYPDRDNRRLRRLIAAIDRRIYRDGSISVVHDDAFVGALWKRWDQMISILEARYRLKTPGTDEIDAEHFNDRVARVTQAALHAGETSFGLPIDHTLDPISRVFRLRRTYWNALFPQPGTSNIENELLDLDSIRARMEARHFQLVDVTAYLDFTYLETRGIVPGAPCPPAGSTDHARLVEYVLLLGDILGRVMGHTIAARPSWRGRRCIVRFGSPIPVPPPTDRTNRGRVVATLQREIEQSLAALSCLEG